MGTAELIFQPCGMFSMTATHEGAKFTYLSHGSRQNVNLSQGHVDVQGLC